MELKAPLRIVGAYDEMSFWIEWIEDADGNTVADVGSAYGEYPERMTKDAARRFVACVNACASIPTYQLTVEDGKPNDLGSMIDRLRAERDGLLVVLKLAHARASDRLSITEDFAIKDAIAAVEQPAAAPAADGWIEWKGGECPIKPGEKFEVRLANGEECIGDVSPEWCWSHDDPFCEPIVAYRVVQVTAS